MIAERPIAAIEQVEGLQGALDGKAAVSAQQVVPSMVPYESAADTLRRVMYQDGALIYATSQASDGSVYKSEDSGTTWMTCGATGFAVRVLHRVPGTGTLIAVGAATPTVARSADDGMTWVNVTTLSFAPLGNQSITTTPSGYILIGEYGNIQSAYRVMRSVDDGLTWQATFESSGIDPAGDPGHIHSITYDTVAECYVMVSDRSPGPDIYMSSDEGATWDLIGSSTETYHPNFVAPMYFADYIAWGTDNTAGGLVYRLPRADFYNGVWGSPEVVATLNKRAAYWTFPVRPGIWLMSVAAESVGGDSDGPGSYASDVFIVSDNGSVVSGGISHAAPSVNINALIGGAVSLPGYAYNSTSQSGRGWMNVAAANYLPTSINASLITAAVPFSVGISPPITRTDALAITPKVLGNGVPLRLRDTAGDAMPVLLFDTANRVVLKNASNTTVPEIRLYGTTTALVSVLFNGTAAFSVTNANIDLCGKNLRSVGTGSPTWMSGAGSPEGVKAAPVGSFYSRTDGGPGTSFYVKESGTGNTGWVAK